MKFMLFSGNAVKFTGDHGKVEVTLERANGENQGMVEFCVSDTGCGIPEDFKSKIFEPFSQFFRTSRGAGTGLGMTEIVT